MSHFYIKIDSASRERPKSSCPSDCTIVTSETLEGTHSLKSIMIPVTYFNINETNNVVYWSDTSGSKTCLLPPGYYNSFAMLASALATAMTAAGAGTVTCSVSPLNNRLTISNTVNFQLTFGNNTSNSAATILGFVGTSPNMALTQTGSKTMNLNTTTCYNFQFSTAYPSLRTVDNKSFTFSIPALTATPNMFYYEPPVQFPITFRLNSTRALQIRITDDQYRVINNMCSDFWCVLEKIGG